MTEKRKYEKPSQMVIELKKRSALLAGSLEDPNDYKNGGDPLSF